MPGTADIIVRGRAEVERAFLDLRKEVLLGIKPALLEAVKPAAAEASRNMDADISNIGDRWDQVRVGATVKGVYLAPKQRRGRNRNLARPNLAPLLTKAMQQAVDDNQEKIVEAISLVIDAAAARNGFLL